MILGNAQFEVSSDTLSTLKKIHKGQQEYHLEVLKILYKIHEEQKVISEELRNMNERSANKIKNRD